MASVDEKRRRRHRSASPASSTQGSSSQAHTDTDGAASATSSEHGGDEVCALERTSFSPLPTAATFLVTDVMRYSQFPFRNNYAMRKRGYRVFVGQLYKEVSPAVLSAVLSLLFPQWVQGEAVDMECHTNPLQAGRGKGCAWVWTATEEMRDALLSVHKEVLVVVDPSGQFLQLVVTAELLHKMPHLAQLATPLPEETASLEAVAQQRRSEMSSPQSEWLLPKGPMTVEVPLSRRSGPAHHSMAVSFAAVPTHPLVGLLSPSAGNSVERLPSVSRLVTTSHNPYDLALRNKVLCAS